MNLTSFDSSSFYDPKSTSKSQLWLFSNVFKEAITKGSSWSILAIKQNQGFSVDTLFDLKSGPSIWDSGFDVENVKLNFWTTCNYGIANPVESLE